MLKQQILILFFVAFLPGLLFAKDNNRRKLPTMHIFVTVKKIWMQGEAKKLQPLLSRKISLNLGKQKGRYSKEHAIAILNTYFKEVKTTEFKYYKKKMQLTKASALCAYKLRRSGKKRLKIIYVYLVFDAKKRQWFIGGINIIG